MAESGDIGLAFHRARALVYSGATLGRFVNRQPVLAHKMMAPAAVSNRAYRGLKSRTPAFVHRNLLWRQLTFQLGYVLLGILIVLLSGGKPARSSWTNRSMTSRRGD